MRRADSFRLADGALSMFLKLRKNEMKCRAFADFTARFDRSGVFLNDAVGNRQTETRAAADAFCREKRIVDFAQVFGRNSFARIGNFDHHFAVFVQIGGQSDRSAADHRIARIKNQVGENLLEFSGVAED